MKRRTQRNLLMALMLALVAPAGMLPQGPGDAAGDASGGGRELRAAMQDYFENRLRAALSLTDDQVQHILPRVERFEEQKRLSQREIAESVRRLRRGLDQGATDAELRELLERIDRSEREQWERERLPPRGTSRRARCGCGRRLP